MKFRAFSTLAGAGLVFASAATAQTGSAPGASNAGFELEEIVVTARRKDESLQDVPTTINAVTGAEMEKLAIRNFTDVASVIPGLALQSNANGVGGVATVRGVAYDVNASGNNGTVEFYMNDAPIAAGNLFQNVYDIQQVELLRGPQGTLRGRASPSGSMTVTTRRPDLQELGGYGSGTVTNTGGYNINGALGVPVITDMLGVRVAASYDKNENSRVRSINSSEDPKSETKSGRVTVRFEPTDSLSFIATVQNSKRKNVLFEQVESQESYNPSAPQSALPTGASGWAYITPGDRLSVEDAPLVNEQKFDNYNLQAQWAFLGQKLNYVGVRNYQNFVSQAIDDRGDYFASNYPSFTKGYGQHATTSSYDTPQELRLSSEERVFGMFDYIVGVFHRRNSVKVGVDSQTPILFGLPSPTVGGLINHTAISRPGWTLERSAFTNLTAHIGDATEVSAGVRYISYQAYSALAISGNVIASTIENQDEKNTIWTASAKHNFSDDLMVYATAGSSWRPGGTATGDFNIFPSPLEASFVKLLPEKSTSYELGTKFTALDKRLRGSVSVYYQKFDNFPFRSASGIYYVNTGFVGGGFVQSVNSFNFVSAVPVDVKGLEAEIAYQPLSQLDMSASVAYADGKIKNGSIPCNDYNPKDGVPDATSTFVPTVGGIQAATGGGTISACTVNQSASLTPKISGSVQSEYRMPITDWLNSFVRGQVSLYGSSKNDPNNTVDDYKSYQLLNLFTGVRDPNGIWEVSVYGKNVTNTERVLSRTPVLNTGYNVGATGFNGLTNYHQISMTNPREFGLTVRYAFGSK